MLLLLLRWGLVLYYTPTKIGFVKDRGSMIYNLCLYFYAFVLVRLVASLCSRAILENTSTTSGLAHEKLGGSGEGDPTVPGPSDGLRLVRSCDLNQSSASFGSGFKLSFPHRGSLARGCGGWETRSRFLL